MNPLYTWARVKPQLSKVPVQLSADGSASLLLRLLLDLAVCTFNSLLWTPKPDQNFISMKWKEKSIKRLGVTKLKINFFQFNYCGGAVHYCAFWVQCWEYEKSPQNYTIEVHEKEEWKPDVEKGTSRSVICDTIQLSSTVSSLTCLTRSV